MKSSIVAVCILAISLLGCSEPGQSSASAAESEAVPADLREAIRNRHAAIDARDADTWDRLTADQFTQVDTRGTLRTKAERIAQLRQEPAPVSPSIAEQEQVRVFGDAAFERARFGDLWVLQVWARTPEGWQVVATQLTSTAQ